MEVRLLRSREFEKMTSLSPSGTALQQQYDSYMADQNRNEITTSSYLKFLAARPTTTPPSIGFQTEELQ